MTTDEITLNFSPIWEELTGADQPVTWVLPGLLPEGEVLVLGGMAGAGKSMVCYALALGMATGTTALTFTPPRPFRVLYCDEENNKSSRIQYQRWLAWGLGIGPQHETLLRENFHGLSFHLGHDRWADTIETAIDAVDPDVIVFDTANSCFDVQDENDNAEATQTINQLRRLQRRRSPTISMLVLKHAKLRTVEHEKGAEVVYTLRGAKAWEGAVDGTIFQVRGKGRGFRDPLLKKTLHNTWLRPGKVRAYGLSEEMLIQPKGVTTPQGIGLVLRCGAAARGRDDE